MFTLRATRKLLTRMNASPDPAPAPPTTILGDWYAHLAPGGLVVCVSETTLLPVVLSEDALPALRTELPRAVASVLGALGIDEDAISRERFAMAKSTVSTTANRRVVGFLNEFAFLIETELEYEPHRSLPEIALRLAQTPCNASSPNVIWPDRATRSAFAASRA